MKKYFSDLPIETIMTFGNLAFIIIVTILGAYLFRLFYSRSILRATAIMKNDPTSYKFLAHAGSAVIYIIGFSWAIYETQALRSVAQSLLATAGILAFAVGLASQHALSNIISGIFIVIFKPFRVNQRIKIRENLHGLVEDITLRHVIIRDFENRRIIIPNTVISQEVVVNADIEDVKICKWIEFNISLDGDISKAKLILQEEVSNHRFFIDNRTTEQLEIGIPLVIVRVIEIGSYFIRLRAWAWANNSAEAFEMGCDLLESVKHRFDEEGITIPIPHQAISLKVKDQPALNDQ